MTAKEMTSATNIDFHFDPACPLAWRTALWVREARKVRPLHVTWRFFSLEVINRKEGTQPDYKNDGSLASMRTLALARRQGGNDAGVRLYLTLLSIPTIFIVVFYVRVLYVKAPVQASCKRYSRRSTHTPHQPHQMNCQGRRLPVPQRAAFRQTLRLSCLYCQCKERHRKPLAARSKSDQYDSAHRQTFGGDVHSLHTSSVHRLHHCAKLLMLPPGEQYQHT